MEKLLVSPEEYSSNNIPNVLTIPGNNEYSIQLFIPNGEGKIKVVFDKKGEYTKYSKVLKESGIVWDEANLDKWLTNPKGMYPGTKMIYPGLKKAEDRADVIEYLKTK